MEDRKAGSRRARPPRRIAPRGGATVEVDAPIDAVWEVVRDPLRVGEWSHECIGAEYLDGGEHPAPGVRFRGRNRQGVFRWGRTCEVVSIEPYELVWRTVPTKLTPDSSVWTIRLTPTATGTRIEQSFELTKMPRALGVVLGTIVPAHRDRDAALEGDMRRLGELATRPAITPPP